MYEICARQEIKVEMAGTPKPQLKYVIISFSG